MGLKLLSHVNADGDLIEAWLKYYIRLGVDRFHLIVHGAPEDNERLFAIKDSYPITIEDTYQGPFESEQKKNRLDALLARCTDQWVVLVDSDEFVEFPYRDIPETIRMLSYANANLMAAPMLQRMKNDGSLETPSYIDDPFQMFPLCSIALYLKLGIDAEIFKFPLFYCVEGTRVLEEGNHNPPLGCEPQPCKILGVTHHFKFRSAVSQRLQMRINSAHAFRQESVQLREYLDCHFNCLPLEDSFLYSRDELFRRGLLKNLSSSDLLDQNSSDEALAVCHSEQVDFVQGQPGSITRGETSATLENSPCKKVLFVLPAAIELGGLETYVLNVVRSLCNSRVCPVVMCFERDIISANLNQKELALVTVRYESEPQSLVDWLRLIRRENPTVIVLCYSWIEAFSWRPVMAALLAGVRKRFSIQYLMPSPVSPPDPGFSPANLVRRLIGKRARRLRSIKFSGLAPTRSICVNNAVRDALVNWYGFPTRNTITIPEGVFTSFFIPCKANGAALRSRMGIGPDDFLLICVARLSEDNGIDILIHALSRVLRQGVECKCIIIGGGPLREQLIRKANTLGLFNWIFFEGCQSDVRAYLQAGSAFILTSFVEGLSRSALEAMACGLPCIVTNVGGSAEVINGEVGLLIDPPSVDATAEAIEYLATHPSECAEMASRARETVCRVYDFENRIEDLRAVLLN